MFQIKRTAAVFAAVASIAAISAAPASAQDVELGGAIAGNPCTEDPEPNTCVNWAADVLVRTLEYVGETYDEQVQPVVNLVACEAYDIISTEECPSP